ncbi:putative glycoside hydrolase [Patescibacteria group bacterium]|nr:putative glycoside hydrolase [Patescibacteria group bacterium]MBU4580398.1 putative glycoside hydrolase [Patescibacteria group bacterium]
MEIKNLKIIFVIFLALAAGFILFFSFSKPANEYEIGSGDFYKLREAASVEKPEAHEKGDIEPQKPLANPPEEIRAIYATSNSAGSPVKMDNFIKLIKKANLNAIVIDIKDYSGYVFYDSGLEDVEKYKAEKIIIPKINTLIKKLHDENIYAIARVVVFQDPVLAGARPELAVKNKNTGGIWRDNLNLAWLDPSAPDVWDYVIKISQNAASRGFDEINFDYIRFPSDGYLGAMSFPFYGQKNVSKEEAIKEFFIYLRSNLKGVKISADLFGLTTSAKDDLGIGQVIEDAYQNFDAVSPMVYPSHYAKGFLGFAEPASHPYEVVRYAIESAAKKLEEYNKTEEVFCPVAENSGNVKIRPWIQAFNMGGIYDAAKIKIQIKASDEAGGAGWMLWNPANNYSFLNEF